MSEGTGDNPVLATTVWLRRSSSHPPRAPGFNPDETATASPHESTACSDPRQHRVSLTPSPRVPAIPRVTPSLVFSSLKEKLSPHPTLQDTGCLLGRGDILLGQLGLVGFPQSSQCCPQHPSKEEPGRGTGANWSPAPGVWSPPRLPRHRSATSQERCCNSPLGRSPPSARSPGAASGSPPAAASSPVGAEPKNIPCGSLPPGLNPNQHRPAAVRKLHGYGSINNTCPSMKSAAQSQASSAFPPPGTRFEPREFIPSQ